MNLLFMKLKILLVFIVMCLSSCADDDARQNNPNLLNVQFSIDLNLSFPQYSQLNFSGNAIYVFGPDLGNDGIIVVNTGSGFVAWDASDPNLIPANCTRLVISGLTASNTCPSPNSYSLVTGQPLEDGLRYSLLNYRVSEGSGSIRVFN